MHRNFSLHIILCFAATFLCLCLPAQNLISDFKIVPAEGYRYLLKSPTSLSCDSAGAFHVVGFFYRNMMPMADNSKIIWGCSIASGDGRPAPFNEPVCDKIEVLAIYLFFDTEVYIYSLWGKPDTEAGNIYAAPQYAVIEYYDTEAKQKGYLRSAGGFNVSEVE